MEKIKPELLAPAGSFNALKAAISAGCDAVYLGGQKFGARANAQNFNKEQLQEALILAHIHNKKIYYTMNTLVKEKETEELIRQVTFLNEIGIDALILQDIGAYHLIHDLFPSFPLHASTQMTIHSLEGAKFIQELGFERVVLSRELSLNEITNIRKNLSIEIECFTHGALCYSYSGQCLMSSLIGGRSGNRGRCAQPCRLPYELLGDESKRIPKSGYLLSPKDIQTIEILPDLIKSGIHSFKIEGRMKKPHYVYQVIKMYRKYIDLYFEDSEKYSVKQEDMLNLAKVYNRGGFSKGYYYDFNGPYMMSTKKPNHQGIHVGTVKEVLPTKKKNVVKVIIKLKFDLSKGDIIEIEKVKGKNNVLTLDRDVKDKLYTLHIEDKGIKPNGLVYQLIDQNLMKEIEQEYMDPNNDLKLNVRFIAKIGQPCKIQIQYKDYYIEQEGNIVEKAKTQALSKKDIIKRLNKTGNYPVSFEEIELDVDKDVFISIGELNHLRRVAIEEIIQNITNPYKRDKKEVSYIKRKKVKNVKKTHINILIRTKEQFQLVKNYEIDSLYVSFSHFTIDEINEILEESKYYTYKSYVLLPRITRQNSSSEIQRQLKDLRPYFDGFLVSTIDAYNMVSLFDKEIRLDYPMNIMNRVAIDFWDHQGVNQVTLSPELNKKELLEICDDYTEILVYGFIPVMISTQCIQKNCNHCDASRKSNIFLKDRMNQKLLVEKNCKICLNIIYNSVPLMLLDEFDTLRDMNISKFRIDFLNESANDIIQIMEIIMALKNSESINFDQLKELSFMKNFTRGHFTRGVK